MEGLLNMMFCQDAVSVSEMSQAGEVRRRANRIAVDAGLGEQACGRIAIVATEIANNIARYADGGEVLLRSFEHAGVIGVEILAFDRGPGIANVAQCLEDGYSTGGTPGTGLGAVSRLSSEFDIFSSQPAGTVVLSRIYDVQPRHAARKTFEWGVVNRPVAGEVMCGDNWRIAEQADKFSLMIADGLGHGPLAADAANLAAAAFEENEFTLPTEMLSLADRKMRGTRGAAVAIASIDLKTNNLEFAGVGNIAGTLRSRLDLKGRGLVSHNGTVGVEMRKVQKFDYECPAEALLVMHSDGLQSRWSLETYPGLANRHPAIIAGVLARDFTRGRDDVTVGVVRFSASVGQA